MAGNKKNRQYHRPPKQNVAIKRPIRLSQCMIVKNEEKNIVRALTWAKDIAFEQIVVDTGSTDRTVEIAENMGAKVYHFDWIDDFSAAKNYAISKAKGNWIAFLDADEYFPDGDVKKLMLILENIESDPQLRNMKSAIRCPIVNINDEGKPYMVLRQDRVFRNDPEVFYYGRIHEYIVTRDPFMNASELSIIHTGYTNTSYAETGKATRNINMLREELRRDPDNASLKVYLADSLRVTNDDLLTEEAESLYREALNSEQPVLNELKQGAYNYLITRYFDVDEKEKEIFEFCKKAFEEFPENPDFCYYYARKLYVKGEYSDAWDKLIACESLLKRASVNMGSFILSNPLFLFFLMVLTAEQLDSTQEVIRYATFALKEDRYQPQVIAPYIQAFKRPGYETSDDEIFDLLKKIYDFDNVKDKITVMRAAKDSGNMQLVAKVLSAFSSEELEWLVTNPGVADQANTDN